MNGITFKKIIKKGCVGVVLLTAILLQLVMPVSAAYTIRESDEWQALQRPEFSPMIVRGTALDMSRFSKNQVLDRLVIRDGQLEQESRPGERFVLWSAVAQWHEQKPNSVWVAGHEVEFATHAQTDKFVDELVSNGYNAMRLNISNWNPKQVVVNADKTVTFNETKHDQFEYLVYKLKENNIYISFPLTAFVWGFGEDDENYHLDIMFDEDKREEWKVGVQAILTRVNKYTGTALINDPQLAYVTCYNEQEFAFEESSAKQNGAGLPWDSAQAEWKTFAGSNAPKLCYDLWQREGDYIGQAYVEWAKKADEFIASKERFIAEFYKDTFSEIGYEGIFTYKDCKSSLHHIYLREDLECASFHSYYDHPVGNTLTNGSSLSRYSPVIQQIVSSRHVGQAMVVNEAGIPFPNQYRYEEAYSMGAYAAFQGLDGFIQFNHPSSAMEADGIRQWEHYWDPISKANGLLETFLYLRGDVSEGGKGVSLVYDEKNIRDTLSYRDALSVELGKLMFAVPVAVQSVNQTASEDYPVSLGLVGGTKVVSTGGGGFEIDVDSSTDTKKFAEYYKVCRLAGIVPEDNPTVDDSLIVSSTGELTLEAKKSKMTINTARFQGMVSKAGESCTLDDVDIQNKTTNGSVSVISLKDDKSIKDSDSLLLVYVTDAVNSDMKFRDENRKEVVYSGENPTLIQTGTITVTIKNNGHDFRVYPLEMNGVRRAPLEGAVSKRGGVTTITIDTSDLPDGPALYFELEDASEPVSYGSEFTVTIQYQYDDGTKVADDVVVSGPYGTKYEVKSPVIDGYRAMDLTVSGYYTKDETIVVIYRKWGQGVNEDTQTDPLGSTSEKKGCVSTIGVGTAIPIVSLVPLALKKKRKKKLD